MKDDIMLENFYGILKIKKDELVRYTKKYYNDDSGSLCICCFCANNSLDCGHSCCKTHEMCKNFKLDEEMYKEIKNEL